MYFRANGALFDFMSLTNVLIKVTVTYIIEQQARNHKYVNYLYI